MNDFPVPCVSGFHFYNDCPFLISSSELNKILEDFNAK